MLEEAQRVIGLEKLDEYGEAEKSFAAIATGWALIIGAPVNSKQVALCMVWLKTMRETNLHKRDNLVDMAGYTGLAAQIELDY